MSWCRSEKGMKKEYKQSEIHMNTFQSNAPNKFWKGQNVAGNDITYFTC